MSRAREIAVSAFLLLVIVGHLYDVAMRTEHWPFSSYPMYAETYRAVVSRKEIVGVTAGGEEIPLRANTHLSPFDNTRMHWALNRVLHDRGEPAYRLALARLLDHYEHLREQRRHEGPPIVALRSYAARWTIASHAINRGQPSRKLQFEASADGARTPRERP